MKFRVLSLLMVVALISPAIFAQSKTMIVNVPFSFYVAEQKLPAGEYIVMQLTEHTVALKTANGKLEKLAVIMARDGSAHLTESKLVFEREADDYILTRVVDGTKSQALLLPGSATHRDLARKRATVGTEYQGMK